MRVIFRKQVHSTFAAVSSSDVWLWREFDLPPEVLPALQPGNDFEAGDFVTPIVSVTIKIEPEPHLDVWAPADDYMYQIGRGLPIDDTKRTVLLAERVTVWLEAGWMVKHEA